MGSILGSFIFQHLRRLTFPLIKKLQALVPGETPEEAECWKGLGKAGGPTR